MGLEVLIPILGVVMVMIPVAGLTLTLTTRFALQPLAKTIADAIRESGYGGPKLQEREDLLRLTEQVEALSDEVARLRRLDDFDRKLVGKGD